jgi:Cenp-O kinetochore centromere component
MEALAHNTMDSISLQNRRRGDDILSIHRDFLEKTLQLSVTVHSDDHYNQQQSKRDEYKRRQYDDHELSMLEDRLSTLRKRRLQLQQNLQDIHFNQHFVPLSQELMAPSVQGHKGVTLSFLGTVDVETNEEVKNATTNDKTCSTNRKNTRRRRPKNKLSLADQIHSLRKRRRIVGSHRIAGISTIPCHDPNVLGIRMDIALEKGRYVAKHFAFFDFVESVSSDEEDEESDQSYWLRLIQHTLPSSVRVSVILDRHFGGPMLKVTGDQGLSEEDLHRLQGLLGDVQDACYAHAVRKHAVEFLCNFVTQDTTHFDSFAVHNLVYSESFRQIEFELSWTKPESKRVLATMIRLSIRLIYDEDLSALPTAVDVIETDTIQLKFNVVDECNRILRFMPVWNSFEELERLLHKK